MRGKSAMMLRWALLVAITTANAFQISNPMANGAPSRRASAGCGTGAGSARMTLVDDVEVDLNSLKKNRKILQTIAKKNGIAANLKTEEMVRRLRIKAEEPDAIKDDSKAKKADTSDAAPKKKATSSQKHSFNTLLVHGAGKTSDKLGSVNMPIYQTSTFRFESAEEGAKCFAGESDGYIYSRIQNPTVKELEEAVAVLEHGFGGIATATGMGAVNVLYMSLLGAGKHVVCHKTVYGPSRSLLENTMVKNFGVEASFVDTCDLEVVKASIQPNTALVYLESPANPTVSISDITEICKLAHAVGAVVCVDNTFCSPYLQNPLTLGADVVIHSLTKSINGHADVVGGMIVTKDQDMYKKLRPMMVTLGASMDANQAFLVRRGMKTLGLRMEAAQKNAIKVADFLEAHPKVAWVRYPGLKSHPQHKLSKKMMKGPGAMISFGVKGGLSAGRKLLNSVELCVLAVSLGGVETLIQHPASMTHAKLTPEARLQGDVTDDLVRMSVGIEDADEIIDDLEQALGRV
eukprot:CAMPEP_0173377754 /NCGR_PEP_ID=MMETSP1356-20130122/1036_1 /TAXON_ID=77927 ORGANISM="Hemiselmis virescens, Strain PCC157" /NCGR_SAMPLE_ID=MMETSP1356 /ASSEMBLY_ACC=CAM_ASM_000847 /LENGTH=518 /DNA_ID=CAMNT_0014330623 /DNA_START=10 /DNA_END=1566 /DNA_ORIENTATION=+